MPKQGVPILRYHPVIAILVFTRRVVLPSEIDRAEVKGGRYFPNSIKKSPKPWPASMPLLPRVKAR